MIPARATILRSVPAPSFARDFAATKALNNGVGPAISFSRGSNATYFDATGTLQYADNNGIRNSEGVGAVAGTPGTVPTNWSAPTTNSGLSRQIVGTGTANGFNYIDIRYSGTTTAASGFGILFESTTGIVSFLGQTGNTSVSLAVVGGSVSNITRVGITVQEWAGGSNVATSRGADLRASLTSTLQRFNYTATFSNATTTNSIPLVEISFPTGIVVDFTLRISAPQYQVGVSSPTDYKPTTSTAYYGPRFDHDPVTKQSKGLLIEESRTNLVTFSNDLTQSTSWLANLVTRSKSGTGPDSVSNSATQIVETASSGQHYIYSYGGNASTNATSYTSGTVYTQTMFLKKGIGATAPDWVQVMFSHTNFVSTNFVNVNLTTGAVGNSDSITTTTMTSVGNGWWRVSITATATATGTSYGATTAGCNNTNGTSRTPNYLGLITSDWYVYGGQLESGSFPTSYIPTGASTATRSADVAAITGNDFLNFYSRTGSTLFTKASIYQGCPASINDNSNRFQMIGSGAIPPTQLNIRTQSSANTVNVTHPATFTGLSFASSAIGIDANYLQVTVNGRTLTSPSYLGLVPPATQLQIGTGTSTNYICGCISQIAYYPRRLNDQQLIALTR